eukprot:5003034-Lingulodinium_polyedra.AAC.1
MPTGATWEQCLRRAAVVRHRRVATMRRGGPRMEGLDGRRVGLRTRAPRRLPPRGESSSRPCCLVAGDALGRARG